MIYVVLHNVNLAVPVAYRSGIQIIIWTNNFDIDLLDFVFVYQLTEISVDVFIYFFNVPVYLGYRQVFVTFNETLQRLVWMFLFTSSTYQYT
jgi:hypothetical protein